MPRGKVNITTAFVIDTPDGGPKVYSGESESILVSAGPNVVEVESYTVQTICLLLIAGLINPGDVTIEIEGEYFPIRFAT